MTAFPPPSQAPTNVPGLDFKRYRQIAVLALPILVSQLGNITVAFADNIMVGHYSTPALAAASLVNNMFNVAVLCIIGFTYGLTPLAGALYGSGHLREIGRLTRSALRLNSIFTLGVMTVMAILYFFLDSMGQPHEIMGIVKPYYLLMLIGLLPVALFNVLAQWSYAITDSSIPMWTILASNVLNIAGNYLLIFGNLGAPELGLFGAGLSTLAARVLSLAVMVWVILRLKRYTVYRSGLRLPRPKGELRKLWVTSLPVAMQMTFESGSFTGAAIMTGWLGKEALAAFQIIVIIGTLGFCIYYSLGAAISVKVANASGDRLEMRRTAWAGYHMMLLLMVGSSLTFIFLGNNLMRAFTDDPAVLAITATLIFPLVLYQLGDATQVTFANALRGTSRVMPMLWIAFVSYIVVGIPATYLFGIALPWGVWGIILSFTVSLFMAGVGFLYYFLRATRP